MHYSLRGSGSDRCSDLVWLSWKVEHWRCRFVLELFTRKLPGKCCVVNWKVSSNYNFECSTYWLPHDALRRLKSVDVISPAPRERFALDDDPKSFHIFVRSNVHVIGSWNTLSLRCLMDAHVPYLPQVCLMCQHRVYFHSKPRLAYTVTDEARCISW